VLSTVPPPVTVGDPNTYEPIRRWHWLRRVWNADREPRQKSEETMTITATDANRILRSEHTWAEEGKRRICLP